MKIILTQSILIVILLSVLVCIGCLHKQNKKLDPDTPIIVWWSDTIFPHVTNSGEEKGLYEITCPKTGVTCLSTHDRTVINTTSDRLLTVMIYGTDFRAYEAPLPRRSNHLWALFHEESPLNNYVLTHKDALSVFNFSATFKRESDFPLTTQHIPNLKYFRSRKMVSIEEKSRLRKKGLASAVYLQSHCDVPSDRDRFVAELMKHMSVDSYGGCLHNKDFEDESLIDTSKMNDEALYNVLDKYKFHLAFENALCDDYFTEKFLRPFHLGAIPIFYGSRKIRDFAPMRDAVVVASDFENPKSLSQYLKYLDENDEVYMRYMRYKAEPAIHNDILRTIVQNRTWSPDGTGPEGFVGGYECYVCEKMHELRQDIKAGRPIKSRQVPPEHLSCPTPKPSFGSVDDIPPSDHLHRWIEDYEQSADQAGALKEMIEDQVENAESLWDYVERRYNAGKGALQHSEL